MTAMWQQIKQHRVAIGIVGIVLVVVIALVIVVVWFNGTGFDGYTQVTTTHTISGPSAGTVVRTEVHQPGKALWDWMQLLIIPAVLVVGGFLLNYTMSRNERKAAEKRDKTERDVALDNQREAALQAYIDSMSELLLGKGLRKSGKDDEVRTIAKVRTWTVLLHLDGWRKRSVLLFLNESGLIEKGQKVIDLSRADLRGVNLVSDNLRGVDLREANLRGARLCGVDLSIANLSGAMLYNADLQLARLIDADLTDATLAKANFGGADLRGADLSRADLLDADLSRAKLSGADLSEARLIGVKVTNEQLDEARSLKGAFMPDGKKRA